MRRKYFDTILLKKVYRGEKSINLVVGKDQGSKFIKAILSAIEREKDFDLAIYFSKTRKDGRTNMTITQKD